jgi:hypothetical protein
VKMVTMIERRRRRRDGAEKRREGQEASEGGRIDAGRRVSRILNGKKEETKFTAVKSNTRNVGAKKLCMPYKGCVIA